MRVLAIIFGIMLLIPGLCTLGFGAYFFTGFTSRASDPSGEFGNIGVTLLLIGALLSGLAVALFIVAGKK